MSGIESQIRQAQKRLWFNRWLRQWGWSLLCATAAWTLIWIVDRLFALKLPMGWAALAGLGASLLVASIWLIVTREPIATAAVALDVAAQLRERISSSLYARNQAGDPFAEAVVADAERAAAGLRAGRLFPVRWSGSLSLSAAVLLVALLSLLLPEFDILGKKEALGKESARLDRMKQAQAVLAQPVSTLQQIAERNPDLEMGKDVKDLQDALKRQQNADPEVLRRETVKKIDRLQDALKQKADSDRYKALAETKKRLQQAGQLSDPKTELGKLMENLSAGDFNEAQKSIKELQEKLAKRAKSGGADAKQTEQMRKQLDELAQKVQKAAEDKQSEQELKNAGMSEEEAKRTLDALSKKDPKQLEKMAKELSERLKDKGVTEQQLQDMMKKIQQRQQACNQCKQMSSKMAEAGRQLQKGDTQAAADELGEAAEQLSEMEQMEQGLNDIESQMSQLDGERDGLNNQGRGENKCPRCNGTGFQKDGSPCPGCDGTGSCSGAGNDDKSGKSGKNKGGRGAGSRGRNDNAQTATKDEKGKVKTNRTGRVIGQEYVKGRQLKGQSTAEFQDAAEAAEIDVTDALDKDRVPRIYRKAVRNYFDRLGDRAKSSGEDKDKPASEDKGESSGDDTDKPASGDKDAAAAGGDDEPQGSDES
jgi:hypothetical protein